MISIIICSRKKEIDINLSENIKKTIGCEYELIVIDNSQNQYSVFEAYNLGINKSTGDYWCFIHDDILFHSQDWGKEVERIFNEDVKIGLIGIAGSKIKTKMPSAWWDCPHELMVVNVIHGLQNNQKDVQYYGFDASNNVEVSVIDGVFMVAKSNESVFFDESLKGFHHYDIFLCLQYLKQQFKIVVTNQVLIEHFLVGTVNESWVKSAMIFDKQYSKMLPLNNVNSCNALQLDKMEFNNGVLLVKKLIEFNLKKSAFLIWLKLIQKNPVSKFHFEFFNCFFRNKNDG